MSRAEVFKLTECERCGYVACVCAFKKVHATTCRRRVAVLNTKPVPCAAHGEFACERCEPCTCNEKNEAADAIVRALEALTPDEQSRALDGACSLLGLSGDS